MKGILLAAAIFVVCLGVTWLMLREPIPVTPTIDPRIEQLEQANDSLDALLAGRQSTDTLYITKVKYIEKAKDSTAAVIATLPPTETVKLFALKTATDSIEMLPDTTAKVTMGTLITANTLISNGEFAVAEIELLTEHLAFRDTTIQIQSRRIQSTDSLIVVKDEQHKKDVSVEKANVKKERKTKIIYIGVAALEGILLTLSMFR